MRSRASRSSPCAAIPACRSTTSRSRSRPSRSRKGDGTRLEQIVFNLLDNALKYTPAGGRVEMTVARDGGGGVIRVRDAGMGIAPEMLRHVFALCIRPDAPLARSSAGLRLGLTVMHRLRGLHGG